MKPMDDNWWKAFGMLMLFCLCSQIPLLAWIWIESLGEKEQLQLTTNTSVPYEVGFECGVIVAKMDILTDTWDGEYKRLSDKYMKLNCQYDNKEEDIHNYVLSM